jgi:tetratricopeptide (TPR) repeat protein
MNMVKRIMFSTMILLIGFVGLVEAKSAKDYVDSGLRKEVNKAVQDYNKAIQLDPNCLEAYFLRGQTYERKGEYDKAIQDLNKAIELKPESWVTHCVRSRIYMKRKEYDKAIQDYSWMKDYKKRGWAYLKKGEYDKAIQDLNKALQLDQKCHEVYYFRGLAYVYKGEYDKAIQDLNKTIQYYPEEVSAYNVIALILATCPESKYRDGAKAVELTEKALSLEGEKWHCVSILAASYAEAGQFDNAVRMQEKAIKLAKAENSEYKNIVAAEVEEQLRSYKQRKPWREYPK